MEFCVILSSKNAQIRRRLLVGGESVSVPRAAALISNFTAIFC
jgi:hypothetical protein